MLLLLLSCLTLLLAPLSYRYVSQSPRLLSSLDGFVLICITGLVGLHILPALVHGYGLWIFPLLVLGFVLPSLSERFFYSASPLTHQWALWLGVSALALHSFIDGNALALADTEDHAWLLALGVVLHRLPVGLTLWWLLQPQFGKKVAWRVLGGVIGFTLIGYALASQWLTDASSAMASSTNASSIAGLMWLGYLQAFITGSILHVVLHRPARTFANNIVGKSWHWLGCGLGALLLLLLLALDTKHAHAGALLSVSQYFYL